MCTPVRQAALDARTGAHTRCGPAVLPRPTLHPRGRAIARGAGARTRGFSVGQGRTVGRKEKPKTGIDYVAVGRRFSDHGCCEENTPPMPRAAKRPCTHPGCGALTDAGRCERHQRQRIAEAGRRKPGERRVYDTRAWRDRIRPAQLRDKPLCEECETAGLVVAATDVDHIDGNPRNNWATNLRSLCHPCHSRKTARQDGGFGNAAGVCPLKSPDV